MNLMMTMLKKKILWIIIGAFLLGLTIGRPFQQWCIADEDNTSIYQELKLFSEVLSIVRNQYVDEDKVKDSKKLIYGAITGLLNSLDDSHTRFMKPEFYKEMQLETTGSFGGLGIEIGIKDEQLTVISPIEETPAYIAGIKGGDKIVEIEGESTKDIDLFEAVHKLRGTKGTPVTITISREGVIEPFKVTIIRDIIKIKCVKSTILPQGNIGYIRITTFNQNTCEELDTAITKINGAGCQNLILDLRNNPGGLLESAVSVTSKFLPAQTLIVTTRGRNISQQSEYRVPSNGIHFSGKLIVLINGGSASGSEIVAGAIQDTKRGVLVGVKSFGKGSVQSVITLGDESGIALTTAKYYTPSGRCIHGIGIDPDIIVEPTELTQIQKENLQKLEDEKIISKFLNEHPTYTDTDVSKLHAKLNKEKGILLDMPILKRMVEVTAHRIAGKEIVCDIETDTQLKRAVDLLIASQILNEVPKK